MGNLHIIDCSATLHAGVGGRFKESNVFGFPTGGIFNTLRILIYKRFNVINDKVVFCFDSKSARKDLSADYKAGRESWIDEMRYQYLVLFEMVRDIGFNYFFQDGYEADDGIIAIHKKYKDNFDNVYIYGTDRDLACCVDEKTTLVSINNNVPDVTYTNYSQVIIPDEYVPYNAILLYKIFRADKSDNIKSVVTAREFEYLVSQLQNVNFPMHRLNEPAALNYIIENYHCSDEIKEKLRFNYSLVIPMDVDINLDFSKQLDYNVFENYCNLLAFKTVAKKFNLDINYKVSEYSQLALLDIADKIESNRKSLNLPIYEKFIPPIIIDNTICVNKNTLLNI